MKKSIEELTAIYNKEKRELSYPIEIKTEDRIVGAIMGAFIGDALGVGCHWIYNFEELWRDYGTWIDDYTDPKKVNEGGAFEMVSSYRYSAGVRAGMSSQSGQLLQIILEAVAANCQQNWREGHFVQDEYIERINFFFENMLLPSAVFKTNIDIYNAHKGVELERGTFIGADNGIKCFSGRYTNEEVRYNFDYWYNHGKKNGRWWHHDSEVTLTSTSDGAQWGVILAALYRDPGELFYKAYDFLNMWYCDKAFVSGQLMYIMSLQAIINGIPLNKYNNYMIALFDRMGVVGKQINSFDDTMVLGKVMHMVKKGHLFDLVDDRFAPIIFGADCHAANLIPCAYYYALKNSCDFENGVLTAVNSSGNNMARATLTGALIGAMVGINGIPKRFIEGLINESCYIPSKFQSQGEYLLSLANVIAEKTNGEIPPLELKKSADCGCTIILD